MPRNRNRGDRHRDERIAELKQRVQEVAGGEVTAWESEKAPPEALEAFWRQVFDIENAATTTNFTQLTGAGVALPDPGHLDDAALSATLWTVIQALAEKQRVFLSHTDHLSDRELYRHLWHVLLHEEVEISPCDTNSAWHVDVLGGWSEEDTRAFLTYYADDESRRDWLEQFPDFAMPAHEEPPYDRDRHLPQPWLQNS